MDGSFIPRSDGSGSSSQPHKSPKEWFESLSEVEQMELISKFNGAQSLTVHPHTSHPHSMHLPNMEASFSFRAPTPMDYPTHSPGHFIVPAPFSGGPTATVPINFHGQMPAGSTLNFQRPSTLVTPVRVPPSQYSPTYERQTNPGYDSEHEGGSYSPHTGSANTPTPPLPKWDNKKKKGKSSEATARGPSFSPEEDAIICSAYLNVSKDPVTGTNQPSSTYWRRMFDYFKEAVGGETQRTENSVHSRWTTIQEKVNKFCRYFSIVERRHESGKNETDRIADATKMYTAKEGPWKFGHCWDILRHEPKWNNRLEDLKGSTRVNNRTIPMDPEEEVEESADKPFERPEGRDSAKRRRRETSSSSTAVEFLEKMNERGQMTAEREAKLQAEMIDLQKSDFELRRVQFELQQKNWERKYSILERDLNIRERQTLTQERQALTQEIATETQVLSTDLQSLPEGLKEYYKMRQQQILARHGINKSNQSGPSL